MKYIELGLQMLGALAIFATAIGNMLPAGKAKDVLLHLGANLQGVKDTLKK